MDAFLDRLWEYLAAGFAFAGESLFTLLQNFHFLGPAVLISCLALCTVCVTKFLNRVIITKRFLELEKTYLHWMEVRQEAMQVEDLEKGRRLARNIDNAELNKAYYDYFFEGLLLGIARKVLPIFFVFAFINEYYRQENLLVLFGRDYVVRMTNTSGEPVLIGAVFWYFLSLLAGYLLWSVGKRVIQQVKAGSRNASISVSAEDCNA